MGDHRGLNILPQKRWNVYNFDNREKVRKDEEAASKEEQLKREQSRKRDAECHLDKLRQARKDLSSSSSSHQSESERASRLQSKSKLNNHINLFEGIKIFNPVSGDKDDDDKTKGFKKIKKEATLIEEREKREGRGTSVDTKEENEGWSSAKG